MEHLVFKYTTDKTEKIVLFLLSLQHISHCSDSSRKNIIIFLKHNLTGDDSITLTGITATLKLIFLMLIVKSWEMSKSTNMWEYCFGMIQFSINPRLLEKHYS